MFGQPNTPCISNSMANTLPVRLYAMMRVGFTPEINALVTLILLFSTVLTLVIARFVGRGGGERFAL